MDKLNIVSTALKEHGFEIEATSYEELIKKSELEYLSKLKELPDGEPSKMLSSFPDLFAIHRSAHPQKGIFFISIIDKLDDEAKSIYDKYFPEQIVVADVDKSGAVQAKWLHDDKKFVPLDAFLKQILD